MRDDVYQAIKLLLGNDPSVPPEQRLRILAACRSRDAAPKLRLGTARQAAEILGCCARTIERWASRGRLRRIQHSTRRIRFDLDEVEAFAKQGINQPKGES